MIKGIHHISMKCGSEEELARVKEFYLVILGLSVCREWPEGLMIDTGNGPLDEEIELLCECAPKVGKT